VPGSSPRRATGTPPSRETARQRAPALDGYCPPKPPISCETPPHAPDPEGYRAPRPAVTIHSSAVMSRMVRPMPFRWVHIHPGLIRLLTEGAMPAPIGAGPPSLAHLVPLRQPPFAHDSIPFSLEAPGHMNPFRRPNHCPRSRFDSPSSLRLSDSPSPRRSVAPSLHSSSGPDAQSPPDERWNGRGDPVDSIPSRK
jgi:hypothetical protein